MILHAVPTNLLNHLSSFSDEFQKQTVISKVIMILVDHFYCQKLVRPKRKLFFYLK